MPTETTLASVTVGTTTWAPVGMVAAADNLAAWPAEGVSESYGNRIDRVSHTPLTAISRLPRAYTRAR